MLRNLTECKLLEINLEIKIAMERILKMEFPNEIPSDFLVPH